MLHRPGIEPGPPAWQASILPLNQRCFVAETVWPQESSQLWKRKGEIMGLFLKKTYLCFTVPRFQRHTQSEFFHVDFWHDCEEPKHCSHCTRGLFRLSFPLVAFLKRERKILIERLRKYKTLKLPQWRSKRVCASPSGNRTPVSRVTGGDTYHYTNEDWLLGESENPQTQN